MQLATNLLSQMRATLTDIKELPLAFKKVSQRDQTDQKISTNRQSMVLKDSISGAAPKRKTIDKRKIQEVEISDFKAPREVPNYGVIYDALIKADKASKSTLRQKTEVTNAGSENQTNKPVSEKENRFIHNQVLGRLNKLGLAVKALGQDIAMSPVRLLNVPIQLGMSLVLFGQSLYQKKIGNYNQSDNQKMYSKILLSNAFISGGSVPVTLLGSTIGLITAPVFNTRHFTGKFGPVGIKLVSVFVNAISGRGVANAPTAEKARWIKDCLTHANNPKVLNEMRQKYTTERVSFLDSFKAIYKAPPKEANKAEALYGLALNLYRFSMHTYAGKTAFFVRVAEARVNFVIPIDNGHTQTNNRQTMPLHEVSA